MSLESALRGYDAGLGLLQKLAAEIPADKFNHEPAKGVNTPAWVVGHLTITADFLAGQLGAKPVAPESWGKFFGPGSPNAAPAGGPGKDELLGALVKAHKQLVEHASKIPAAQLGEPHGIDFFNDSPIKTRGDALTFFIGTHEGTHIGQLSTWRRLMGYKPLF